MGTNQDNETSVELVSTNASSEISEYDKEIEGGEEEETKKNALRSFFEYLDRVCGGNRVYEAIVLAIVGTTIVGLLHFIAGIFIGLNNVFG